MPDQHEAVLHQPGDKVRIRMAPHRGSRGVIQALSESGLVIRLNNGEVIHTVPSELTNFSLAARRAWQTMPKRAGRPASKSRQKKMVSIRIEQDTWEQLGQAVDLGLIRSREQAINEWVRDHVSRLLNLNHHNDKEVPNGRVEG